MNNYGPQRQGPPQQQWQQGPPQGYAQGYPPPPLHKKKAWYRHRAGIAIIVVGALFLCGGVNAALSHGNGVVPSATDTATSVATSAPTSAPTAKPQAVRYPPQTVADLRGLAAQGSAGAIHEFHSESVGAVGVCPQPRREVTVDPGVTGEQLASDLLAYFYAQHLDTPCGSLVLAYHNQAEANDPATEGYTAGRIVFAVHDASGGLNFDPSATNLTRTLTLDTGSVLSSQEHTVTY